MVGLSRSKGRRQSDREPDVDVSMEQFNFILKEIEELRALVSRLSEKGLLKDIDIQIAKMEVDLRNYERKAKIYRQADKTLIADALDGHIAEIRSNLSTLKAAEAKVV